MDALQAQKEYKEKKKLFIENGKSPKGIWQAKLIYPFTKILLCTIGIFGREKITYLNNRNVITPKDRAVIYANTHRFKADFEKISIANRKASWVMASDFVNSYKTINGWYFNTRPTIWIDPYDKEDRQYSKKLGIIYLNSGLDGMIFPEAVWNFSENLLVLDIFPGTVEMALETGSVIVPTAIERVEKEYIINRKGYYDPQEIISKYTSLTYRQLQSAEYVDLKKEIVRTCNQELRDRLATLLWELYEYKARRQGIEKRCSVAKGYWNEFLQGLMAEWPGYDIQANINEQYHNRQKSIQEEGERDIYELLRKECWGFNT